RMSIAAMRTASGEIFDARTDSIGAPLPDAFYELALHGLLASAPHPFDPMERAFHDFAGERFAEADARLSARWTLVHGYGLRPDLLAVTQIWRPDKEGSHLVVAAKGAPEAIAGL